MDTKGRTSSSGDQSELKEEVLELLRQSHTALQKNALKEAQDFAEEALQMTGMNTEAIIRAKVLNQLGEVYIKRQNFSKLFESASDALSISRQQGATEQEVVALNHLAVCHGIKGEYKTAMEFLLEGLEKSKKMGLRRYTSNSLLNVATIYASLYNYQEAINRYETVLEEYQDVIDNATQVVILNNLGNIHYHEDDKDKALACFTSAWNLSRQTNYREMIAYTQAQMGRAYAALGDYKTAFEQAEEAKLLMEELGDINGKQINLINFGNLYLQTKEYDQAIKFTEKGIEKAKEMKDDENEITGYQILAKIYQALEDYEKALDYQLMYTRAQERFAKDQKSRQILDMEIQFAIREKQKEIEQLTKENEYQALLLKQSDQIANQNVQLLQVNDELRQFAYVASHDLKEPLRMIGSYTQLIERKFKDQVDEQTAPFFEFVSEGVLRMNALLDALLKYATIGKNEMEKEAVNLDTVLEIVKFNLQLSIEESGAQIVHDTNLPTVLSVQSLLVQLFQNLISNAIKFRKPEEPPVIRISIKEEREHYLVQIADQGIGIAPEFQERIFVIFQRLHKRSQYAGTGIGLAICQKIVQKLGGQITVNSQLGEGATFIFTISKT